MTPSPYILIADTFETTARHVRALAQEHSLDVLVVTDGEAAVGALHTRGLPRLMYLDLSLANVDGFSVIAELRKLATAERVAVVASSPFAALRDHATRLQAKLGIFAVVAPTPNPSELDHVFRAALAGSHPVMWLDLDDRQPEREAVELELASIAREFGVSAVSVTLVQHDRVVFEATHGMPRELADRRHKLSDGSLTSQATGTEAAPLIVADAASHPAFADNTLVRVGMVGSYVSVPLTSRSGNVLGTLCVSDRLPWLGSPALVSALTARAKFMTATLLAHCG
jgi:DNA-binding response OmpR family regulator